VPDATLLEGDGTADRPCTINPGAPADATCTLLRPYECQEPDQVRPGYESVDTDLDGIPDLCIVVDTTTCDTTGDGLGDTPCIIVLEPSIIGSGEVQPGPPDDATEPAAPDLEPPGDIDSE
jgi:hypothetical protein